MLSPAPASADQAVQFLRLAQQGASIASRPELQRWLSAEVQQLLPHDAVLACAGDFRQGPLRIERLPVGPLPLQACGAGQECMPLAQALRDCWVAARHQPCRVDLAGVPVPLALRGLRSALVHGTRELNAPSEHVIALLAGREAFGDAHAQALRLLLPFIDGALRRLPPDVPPPPGRARGAGRTEALVPASLPLSERERQIMAWVAMGKTNPEIGCILRISEFTVKNHLKSIFAKLDVSNRAQAVAKLTGLTVHG